MKVAALIVAGGQGERFGTELPKQYTNGVLNKTIQKFLCSKSIDLIQVVIRPEDESLYKEATKEFNLEPYAIGGRTRGESVKNGLIALQNQAPDLVLVHDACRPFVSLTLIENIIKELKKNPNSGIVPATKINETIKKIDNNTIAHVIPDEGRRPLKPEDPLWIPVHQRNDTSEKWPISNGKWYNKATLIDRDQILALQTPQGFYFKQLLDIKLKSDNFFSDESTLAELHNIPIKYIAGDKKNIKITYQEDMPLEIRTGLGFDAHKFKENKSNDNSIIIGGIRIQHQQSLDAHSDGDVLIHALVDAILGAIGAGDIGLHFPPSDQKWKNANSQLFLEYANSLLKQKNGSINNIDLTVICEEPRIGKYREAISNNLASILSISSERVNVKATTTEKMGFTGRKEGIAVQAIVTISIFAS